MLAAQPFLALVTGDAFARDIALLLQEPENIELLVTRLQEPHTAA
jgi:hypothetical protein